MRRSLPAVILLAIATLARAEAPESANGEGEKFAPYPFAETYRGIPRCFAPVQPGNDIDWRTKGAVTPVKNRGDCDADWAFSVTGAIEGFRVITRAEPLVALSEQFLVDCTHPNTGCDENSPVRGFELVIRSQGIPRTSDYPYTARPGSCRSGVPLVDANSELCRTEPGNENGLYAALLRGPVAVVVRDNGWMANYHGGVLDPSLCRGGKKVQWRSALVVGYQGGTWIVKNSAGSAFGAQGYFFLPFGQDACGVADFGLLPR